MINRNITFTPSQNVSVIQTPLVSLNKCHSVFLTNKPAKGYQKETLPESLLIQSQI